MDYMKIALEEAKKGYKKNEVPVGAVIVMNNKIIGKAYNIKEATSFAFNHAEILCIMKASKKIKNWNLENADLYVTLKPCAMCEEIIKQARIKNVYYLLSKEENKKEYTRTNVRNYMSENMEQIKSEYKNILKTFFGEFRG